MKDEEWRGTTKKGFGLGHIGQPIEGVNEC